MKIEKDTITFSSGRTAYANCGIVGIDPDLNLSYGYDGGLDWPVNEEDREPSDMTTDDVKELADHMIVLWQKFKETLNG